MKSDITSDTYSRTEVFLDLITFTGVGMAYHGTLYTALPLAMLGATLIATTHQFLDDHNSTSKLIRVAALITVIALSTLTIPLSWTLLSTHVITVARLDAALHITLFQIAAKLMMYLTINAGLIFRNTFFFSFPSSLANLKRTDALSLKKELIDFPRNLEAASLRDQLDLRHFFKEHELDPLPLANFTEPGKNWTKKELDQLHGTETKHLSLPKRAQIAEILYASNYPPQTRLYRLDELPEIDYKTSGKTLTANQLVWAHLRTVLDPDFPILYPINLRFYNLKLPAPRSAWIHLPPLSRPKDVEQLAPHQLSWYRNLFEAQPAEYKNLSKAVKVAFSTRLQQKPAVPAYRPPPENPKRYNWKPYAIAAGSITVVAFAALSAYALLYEPPPVEIPTLPPIPSPPLPVVTPKVFPEVFKAPPSPQIPQPLSPAPLALYREYKLHEKHTFTPNPSDTAIPYWLPLLLLFVATAASKNRSRKDSATVAFPPTPATAAPREAPDAPYDTCLESDDEDSGDVFDDLGVASLPPSPGGGDGGDERESVNVRTPHPRHFPGLQAAPPEWNDTPPPNFGVPRTGTRQAVRLRFGDEGVPGSPRHLAGRLEIDFDDIEIDSGTPSPVRPPARSPARRDSLRRIAALARAAAAAASPVRFLEHTEPTEWERIFDLLESRSLGRNQIRINIRHGLFVVDRIMMGQDPQLAPEFAFWGLIAQAVGKQPAFCWEPLKLEDEGKIYQFFSGNSFKDKRASIRNRQQHLEGFELTMGSEAPIREFTKVWIYKKTNPLDAGAGADKRSSNTFIKFGTAEERFNPEPHGMRRRSTSRRSTLNGPVRNLRSYFYAE